MALTQISTAGVKDDAVTAGKIPANAVGSSELADNAVDTAAIAADAVTGAKIADDAINSEHYTDGSIDTAHIADDAVTYAKMQNTANGVRFLGKHDSGGGAVGEITAAQALTMLNVESGATADQTAGEIKTLLQSNQLTHNEIADDAITGAKLADNAVVRANITDGEVISAKLDSNAVTTSKINNNAVTTDKIADSAVTDAKIASGISANKITGLSTDSITEGDSKVEVIDSGSNGNIQFVTDNTTRGQFKTGSSCDNQLLIGTSGSSNQDIDVGVCIGSSAFSRPGVIIRGNTTNKGDISFCDNSNSDSSDGVSEGLLRYDHATDHMEFHTADSERMRIDSSGKVGIGTTSPTRTISAHVNDSGANYIHLTNTGTGAGDANGTFIGIDAAEGALIWNQESTNVRFATNNTERMRIDSSGHVTTPSQPFFWAYNSSDYSWNSSTISFETEANDTGGDYNNSTYTFTCPVAGVYMFCVYMRTGGTFSEFSWTLQKNGGNFIRIIGQDSFAGNDCSFGQTIQNCSANDTWRVYGSGNHGGATGGYQYNGFQGYLLG